MVAGTIEDEQWTSRMSSSPSDARLRTRNESRETRVNRIVITRTPTVWRMRVIPHTLRHYVSFRTMSGIRNGLQISSEISDQVARGFCQLPNIVLPAYGRAIARSVECWGYRCPRNDFRNRPMSPARGPFAIETELFVRRRCTVHGSLPRAGWIEEVKTMSPVTGEIRRGKPDRNREYPT
jgi:hypothetical protein